MKHSWKDLFYFSKADRTVLMFLVGVLTGVALCMLLMPRSENVTAIDESQTTHDLTDATVVKQRDTLNNKQKAFYYQQEQRRVETFEFDPNTADSTQLLRLGLQPWQVRNIYKYRAKGGRYHRPEDFSKLYGLTKGDYDRLLPFIKIADEYKLMSDIPQVKVAKNDTVVKGLYQEKLKEGETVELNKADTTLLKKVPGIGSYYARRIVEYRKRLGGFVSVGQLSELKDFPEGLERWFVVSSIELEPIYINKLSIDALRRHPYLNFYQAKVIVEHRRKYGPIKKLQSLSLYEEFSSSDLERLQQYVNYDE
ncbi:MAG: helix-hairpin-helix domain-containing protein [Paraprevotella sp.]|nr:helix-hairpin-helix domain-containing protein [Paraprevotella sp.]